MFLKPFYYKHMNGTIVQYKQLKIDRGRLKLSTFPEISTYDIILNQIFDDQKTGDQYTFTLDGSREDLIQELVSQGVLEPTHKTYTHWGVKHPLYEVYRNEEEEKLRQKILENLSAH